MKEVKKVERLPTMLIVKDGMKDPRTVAMSMGGNRLTEEGGGQ
jgi:hypothetical protein